MLYIFKTRCAWRGCTEIFFLKNPPPGAAKCATFLTDRMGGNLRNL